jgi:hypothetical protein
MAKSARYNKFKTLLLPKQIVDLILLCQHKEPLYKVKDSIALIAFQCIDNLINKTEVFSKDDSTKIGAPMYSLYLKKKYGDDYPKYVHWMIMNRIVWNVDYHKGKALHLYLFSFEQYYNSINEFLAFNEVSLDEVKDSYCFQNNIEIKPVCIDNKGIEANQKNRILNDWYRIKIPITNNNKRFLTNDYEDDSVFINNAPKYIKKMGSHYRKTIEIKYDEALTFVSRQHQNELEIADTETEVIRANNRFISRINSIDGIQNGRLNKTLRFSRNATNNRLDTNLTNMASELRQFIVGYENMAYLDLSNSQPVLFNIILKELHSKASSKLKAEIKRYEDITISGQWYEWLEGIYGLTRDECKEIWMQIAYSQNRHYPKQKKKFAFEFPQISKIIKSFKKTNHAKFSIQLQKIESKIFIDEICKLLVAEGIVPYTMHDGLLIPKIQKQRTFEIMANVLKKYLGAVPVIKDEDKNIII